ncbi:hypothetical protein DIPPA_29198 [Diplonema papillatum]|nr:hypothetical protein DIPPA_13145 [Diplonema papillatum]KAJ9461069.1 hypothetical protein DIPPA_29198 [Diplonema papillatum]|eukprot:gene6400-9798_t
MAGHGDAHEKDRQTEKPFPKKGGPEPKHPASSTMKTAMATTFNLPPEFQTGSVLVVGLGGGCDAITAYVVAQQLLAGVASGKVLWGNTKRTRKRNESGGVDSYEGAVSLTPGGRILKVVRSAPIETGRNYYGTVGIDQSIPKGPHGCPFILIVPRVEPGGTVEENELKHLAAEIRALQFVDAIIGVDAGGDSLTGGIDHHGDPSTGVDQMCLRALKYTGLPLIHCVPGFGSDGESTVDQIEVVLKEKTADKTYMGCLSMANWSTMFRTMASGLDATRTPHIMADAIDRLNNNEHSHSSVDKERLACLVVPRGIEPAVPIELLSRAYFMSCTPHA